MKLPSISFLAQHAGHAFLRFPFSIVAGVCGAAIAIYLVEAEDQIKNSLPYVNLLLTFALAIPLFFCADGFTYGKNLSRKKQYVLWGVALVVLAAIYFSLPGTESTQNTTVPYIRYTIYNIAVHLLVAFIPFVGAGQLNGFWHYNKALFVRVFISLLYSAALYAGLALALGSLDFLFDIDVHKELYFDLFILIGGVFNTWFFLAGIPEDFRSLDDIHDYPKGIKIFSQYILLPLLILYLVILYIYAGKIVITWTWPKGIVSYLIACVAVLGILTLLLIHPYGNLSGNSWIRKFSRVYYFILVPLIVLLFTAIGMRVGDYGITINRYVILLLGVWLTIVSTYFVIGKENIKFIPISLAVILIMVSFGYWGMFSVSERSQVARLKTILETRGVMKEGRIEGEVLWLRDSLPKKLVPIGEEEINDSKLSDSLHNEVLSILNYLDDHHGFRSIRGWFTQNLDSIVRQSNLDKNSWMRINEAEAYMRSMGLAYTYAYETRGMRHLNFHSSYDGITDVSAFDYVIDLHAYNEESVYKIDELEFHFFQPRSTDQHAWLVSDTDSLKFEVAELASQLRRKYEANDHNDFPQAEMTLRANAPRFDAKLEVHMLSVQRFDNKLEVDHLSGRLMVRLKKE